MHIYTLRIKQKAKKQNTKLEKALSWPWKLHRPHQIETAPDFYRYFILYFILLSLSQKILKK